MGVHLRALRPWAASAESAGPRPLDLLVFGALALWGRFRSSLGSKAAALVPMTYESFDERFEPFWEAASADWDLIPVRSVAFLNWRFCDPRAGNFTVRAVEEEGALLGYAVLHLLGTRGHIVDLLALPDRLDVVRTLLDDSLAQLRMAGAAAVECWMLREHPYAGVLHEAGFVLLRSRSEQESSEIGVTGPGVSPEERALLESPGVAAHLVRADFDGI